MATYVNDLRLTEIATGDETGDWGDITNTNLELVAEAFSFGTEAITTNADTHTTTIADGATDPGRSIFLKYTGTLDSACTITIGPNTVSKLWFIENGTSGSQNIIISQGSGANITIPPGDTKAVYSDGAGSGAAMVDAFASLSVVDLKVQDDLTVTDDLIVNGDIDLEGSIDVNGTANLDVVDIDGAVDMATTLQVDGVATFTGRDIHSGGITIANAGQIGSVGDADAIAIASDGVVTLTQKLIGTELDISGNIDVDGTTNLDIVDIDGAVDMASTLSVTGNVTLGGQLIMPDVTSTKMLVADGTSYQEVSISGDVTIANTGAVTIAANAVEGSMLNNNVISGQTALTSGLATDDELLVSDGGTLKRMDVSVLTTLTDDNATALAIALG
jgi:cytoskeletal protein CcmA (bactofilin family)